MPSDKTLPVIDRSIHEKELFSPIVVGALYPGIERGLAADIVAARALQGNPLPVCTSMVVAGHGKVTDVLDVPSDTVDAQLQHLFETTRPTCAKIGITGSTSTIPVLFHRLQTELQGPILFDLTLSGPSGEDLGGTRHLAALQPFFGLPDLVMIRRVDAERCCRMEINTLDDAQVAIQRLFHQGMRKVLLRFGALASTERVNGNWETTFAVDLYFDGDEFLLFEAPYLDLQDFHGASSALALKLLERWSHHAGPVESLQEAKAFVTDRIRNSQSAQNSYAPNYFPG